MQKLHFTRKTPAAGRIHYIDEDDVRVLLGRIPERLWSRLRAVHFNDRAWGNRILGRVSRSRREITICALPEPVSLGRVCGHYGTPAPRFGAPGRGRWPRLAVRRFLLYEVFLHELGHMQIVDPSARSMRRKYAGETKAQEFANLWRRRLWKQPFDQPDPAHNPPAPDELLLTVAPGDDLSAHSSQ